MAGIIIKDLTFAHYGAAENLFDHLSITLDTDWRLGFIGRNGRGKTSFLNLLMKRHEYGGLISSPVEFDYFPYDLPGPERPVEAALKDLGDFELWRMEKELARLKTDPEILGRPFQKLSGGERTKVLLAALFLKEGRFPLIDEPTNHLDFEGRQVVGEYLRRRRGFIVVSHDRAFLDLAVDHILSIGASGLEVQQGNYSSWLQNREYQERYEAGLNQKLGVEIKKLNQAARRSADWSGRAEQGKYGAGPVDRGFIGHKAAKIMKRSKQAERRRLEAAEDKKKLLRDQEISERLTISTEAHHAARLLTMGDLTVTFGSKTVLAGVHLTLDQGERLMVSGPNGCGKSTLLKLAAGLDILYLGQLHRSSGLRISWLPQDMSELGEGDLKSWIVGQGLDESRLKAILHKLGFTKAQFDTPVGSFSLGQKKKLLIAACLCRPAHLHIWDEPLNYIDLTSRIQIENLIIEHQPTMLLVEHDRHFAEKVATGYLRL